MAIPLFKLKALGATGAAAAASQPQQAEAAFLPAMFVLRNPSKLVTELNPKATPENLEKAEKMLSQGTSPQLVFRETGAFRGADGGLRFEVSDDTSKFKEEPKLATKEDGTVTRTELLPADQYLDHPALRNLDRPFGETPYMQFVPSEEMGRARGRMIPDAWEGRDVINVKTVEDEVTGDPTFSPRSTLMHELQHSAQRAAGFSPGSSTGTVYNQLKKGLLDYSVSKKGKQDRTDYMSHGYLRDMTGALSRLQNLQELRKYATDSNLTGKRRLLVGRGDWYKHGDDIRRELGPEPKRHRPKAEREQWLSAAWSKLAERQRDEITEDQLQLAHLAITGKRGQIVDGPLHTGKPYDPGGPPYIGITDRLFLGDGIDDKLIGKPISNDRLEDFLSTVQKDFGQNAFKNALNRTYNQRDKVLPGYQRQIDYGQLDDRIKRDSDFDLYQSTAGEVEARNVQNRLNMTMDERLESYPPSTEDVPRERQILIDDPVRRPFLASAAPVATGLLGAAALQPEDAEAKFFTSTQNLLRLGFLTPDSAMNPSAVKGANTKYDKAMRESRAFRARETLRSDIENQTQTLDIGERQIIDPESLLGKVGVPVTGDTSVTGRNLQTIGGIELDNPVMVEGGANFPLRYQDQNFGWASMQSAADKKQKNFRTAQEQTGGMDPVGIFSAMSREAINFSTPVAEALYSQATKLPLAKKDIEEFDRYLRKGPKGTKAKKQKGIKNWVGLQHPDALDQLLGRGDYPRDGSGEIRKQFVEAMELAAFRDRGFPVKEDVYAEAIQSELQGATPGDAGFSIFDALPEVKTTQPNVHQSYDTVIPGTYRGGFEQNIPSRVMFPQIYETLDQVRDKSGNPITEQQKLGSLMMRNDLYEPLNEKWVEGVSKYIKENPKKATTAGLLAAGNANAAQETEPTAQEKFQGILDAAANAGQALTAPAADAPFTAIDALKFGVSDSFPFVTGFTNTPEEVRARQAQRFAQMDFQPGALGQQYTENAQRALGNSPILNALGNVYRNSRILQTPERAITQFADLLPDRGRLVGGSILSALGL